MLSHPYAQRYRRQYQIEKQEPQLLRVKGDSIREGWRLDKGGETGERHGEGTTGESATPRNPHKVISKHAEGLPWWSSG